ncbi:hypothetical protein NQ314_014030 [Rhamnusium bicolor]|uniref:HTH CENPB-type domain-containing protein n=1 Tax=Rhamnusium bicolor TaxID=1586634 RepID=A0AAV8X4G6_9CUCU|nr:hypothetical protein NQ314_014030 [Rhamnusium bicolor]
MCRNMPRVYVRKTNWQFPPGDLAAAVADVLQNNFSIRKSAELHNVKKSCLCNYVKKVRTYGIENVCFKSHYVTTQVFTTEMEDKFQEYLLTCSDMFHGLTPKATRRLAYEYAKKKQCKTSRKMEENGLAGREWLNGFLRRHARLSIRTPEATSLARVTSFNKSNINLFFDKLADVMQRYQFTPSRIYNLFL